MPERFQMAVRRNKIPRSRQIHEVTDCSVLTRREHEIQLSSDIDNEKLSKRHGGEESKHCADNSNGQDAPKVIPGVLAQEPKLVHSGKTGHKNTGHAARAGSGSLDDTVLLRAKVAPENWDRRLRKQDNNSVAEDGTEHGG